MAADRLRARNGAPLGRMAGIMDKCEIAGNRGKYIFPQSLSFKYICSFSAGKALVDYPA
jgi:hypothetical protein